MRWLLVSAQHHPSHGGVGAYVSRFLKAASDAGWRVQIVTRPSALLREMPLGVVAHEVATPDMRSQFERRLPALRRLERVRPYRYALWSLAAAKRLLQIHDRFDAIEFVDVQAEGYVSLASGRVRGHLRQIAPQHVVHAHTPMFVEEDINGADGARFGRSIYHTWERAALSCADGVIVASQLLQRRLGLHSSSAVIPYPIAEEDQYARRAQFVSPVDRIVLVGSVQPRKGLHVWAKSLNQVLRMRPNTVATLVGPDTPTSPAGTSMVTYVRQMIDADLQNRFEWKGALPHHETMSMLRAASLVVVPSLFDNAPFVVAEALLNNVPVLVSDGVGWTEWVSGVPAARAGDVEQLAAAQVSMLADRSKTRRVAAQCRSEILSACAPQHHLSAKAAFVEALAQHPAAAHGAGLDAFEDIKSFLRSVEVKEEELLVDLCDVS